MSDNFSGDFFGLIGKPMLWKTENYGTVAVHIAGISPNGRVATLTIDGGAASTPAQRFPELADGIGYSILGNLSKRPRRSAKEVDVPDTPAMLNAELESMSAMEVRRYARQNYSSIGKLTKKADIIAAIRAQEAKQVEVTF